MPQSHLPREQQAALALRDSLVELGENPAYQFLLARIEDLLQDDQRRLARESELPSLLRLQGRVSVEEAILSLRKDVMKQIDNTTFTEGASG